MTADGADGVDAGSSTPLEALGTLPKEVAKHGERVDAGSRTALEALGVMASQDVMLTPELRHVEMYTMRGLLSLLWHEPLATAEPTDTVADEPTDTVADEPTDTVADEPTDTVADEPTDTVADEPTDGEAPRPRGALVLCGGAMGGLLGPADGLYHRLGVTWAARGVPVIRVGYRKPNDLDSCCADVAAAVQLAVAVGEADRVVVMGHSFGGAVAVRVAVGLREMVAGVVTFATQSAGCEVAGGLLGVPLLLFHGGRDEILPFEASEMVRKIAGHGELVLLPGDGHLLAKSADVVWERIEAWLPSVFGADWVRAADC